MDVKELLLPLPRAWESRLTWSADGTYLAAFAGDVYVWNATTTRLINQLPIKRLASPGLAVPLALSPDGRILAVAVVPEDAHVFGRTLDGSTAAFNSMVELWDVASGRKLSMCIGHKEWTWDLAFAPDGKVLASA